MNRIREREIWTHQKDWDDSLDEIDKCIICSSYTDNSCVRCFKFMCRKHKGPCLAIWDVRNRVLPQSDYYE